MKTVRGDLIRLAQAGHFDVIVHGCNCFCTMGAGFAKQVKAAYPEAASIDATTTKGDAAKLGHFTWVKDNGDAGDFIIVNAYIQYKYGRGQKHVSYEAVSQVFERINQWFPGSRIAYPAIGAGLAGGDWRVISEIIDEKLSGQDHTFVKYDGQWGFHPHNF